MDEFINTPVGPVPRVHTTLSARDMYETVKVRTGYGRYDYRVTPGLYCVGNPTKESPVIVTCNYKLTFDAVRKELDGVDAWLLIADTRGINIWCAAGKNLFSTQEIIISVTNSRLGEVVSHRNLILPQLGATGVAAHEVKKGCGFSVKYGPVRASDLKEYMANDLQADEAMRMVTFTLPERIELIPVELSSFAKPLLLIMAAGFLLSGISPDFFSMSAAIVRGLGWASATLLGGLAGTVLVPLMLPLLPWRYFSAKGALIGGLIAIPIMGVFVPYLGAGELLSLMLWTTAIASYLGMNFTGSTPYTSPTGVELEMRKSLPYQGGAAAVAIIIWLIAPFIA